MQNTTKRLLYWAIGIGLLLSIPLIMTYLGNGIEGGNGWHWTAFDYIFMSALLFGAASVYELVARKMTNTKYRRAFGLGVVTSVVLVWVNAAVGIIGDGPINALYFAVLAIGLLGAILVRFKAPQMAKVLFTMAALQVVIPIIALFIISPSDFSPGFGKVFLLNAFFAAMFVVSGLMFKNAALEQS